MARYIHCEKCNKKMSEDAKQFGELYESIEGHAIKNMSCDGSCGKSEPSLIKVGDKCFAAVLLDSMAHPNYQHQKPELWAHEFITTN